MPLPSIPGYTEQDLANLTDDEITALQQPDGDDEGDDANEVTTEAPATTESVTDDAATDDADPADEPADRTYAADAPADAAATLQTLKDAKAAAKKTDRDALKQLHEGEIDFDEYQVIKDKADDDIEAVNDQVTALNRSIAKAEISAEMTEQQTLKAWGVEVAAMMKQGKAEGLDYAAGTALNKEFNNLVKVFGQEAIERGMSDNGLVASKWALAQAHQMMRMRHADKVTGKAPAAKPGDPPKPRTELRTLARMPNADRALSDGDSLVAKFSTMSAEDMERAIAGMSKDQVEALMNSV